MGTNSFATAIGRVIESILLVASVLTPRLHDVLRVSTGFSRGAYQVRVIAGMIEKVNLFSIIVRLENSEA